MYNFKVQSQLHYKLNVWEIGGSIIYSVVNIQKEPSIKSAKYMFESAIEKLTSVVNILK